MENENNTVQDDISPDQPENQQYNVPSRDTAVTQPEDTIDKDIGQTYNNNPAVATSNSAQMQSATQAQPEPNAKSAHNPILIVMQWLTYAFWGWTAIAILVITSMIFSYFMLSADVADALPYSIAAVLVLLPISVVCDIFYSKKEPEKKIGAASVIMIIHAVIFALCCVASLVVIVLNLVKLLISSSDSTSAQVFIYCALIMFAVYAVLFLRTILPGRLFWMRRLVIIFMIAVAGTMTVISFVGPIANTMLTRNDVLIDNNILAVTSAIDSYTQDNNKLPDTLADISLTGDAKKLVSDNLVTYKNDGRYLDGTDSSYSKVYHYQLCVTYAKADESKYGTYGDTGFSAESIRINNDYSSYLSTSGHPAGEVCYKVSSETNDYIYSDIVN